MLSSLISPSRIKLNLESAEWDECFAELIEVMIKNNSQIKRSQALSALIQREEKMSTAVFSRVAVPHAVCDFQTETQVALGISPGGVEFENLDNSGKSVKVNLIFQIIFGENHSEFHLHILKDILELVKTPDFLENVLKAKSADEVCAIIRSN